MVAKNPAHNERRTAPGQASKGTTYHVDLEPSDIDSEIIDLIDVIEDEISATTDGALSADEPRRETPRHGVTPESAEGPVDQEGKGADDLRDLDTDQLLAEFLASEETDLPRRGRENEPSADESEIEHPAAFGEDLLSELLDDLESTERAVAQEAAAVQPPPGANETPPDPALHDLAKLLL